MYLFLMCNEYRRRDFSDFKVAGLVAGWLRFQRRRPWPVQRVVEPVLNQFSCWPSHRWCSTSVAGDSKSHQKKCQKNAVGIHQNRNVRRETHGKMSRTWWSTIGFWRVFHGFPKFSEASPSYARMACGVQALPKWRPARPLPGNSPSSVKQNFAKWYPRFKDRDLCHPEISDFIFQNMDQIGLTTHV